MGAANFSIRRQAQTAAAAFAAACDDAAFQYGHGGYTGTIAEKHSYVCIAVPKGVTAQDVVDVLMGEAPKPDVKSPLAPVYARYFADIDDKWGPAGIVADGPGSYILFGWASE